MECPFCNHVLDENSADARFCPKCGGNLEDARLEQSNQEVIEDIDEEFEQPSPFRKPQAKKPTYNSAYQLGAKKRPSYPNYGGQQQTAAKPDRESAYQQYGKSEYINVQNSQETNSSASNIYSSYQQNKALNIRSGNFNGSQDSKLILGVHSATLGQRFFAYIIDVIIVGLLGFTMNSAFYHVSFMSYPRSMERMAGGDTGLAYWLYVIHVWYVLNIIYFYLFGILSRGQTIGKYLVGIHLIDDRTNQDISFFKWLIFGFIDSIIKGITILVILGVLIEKIIFKNKHGIRIMESGLGFKYVKIPDFIFQIVE